MSNKTITVAVKNDIRRVISKKKLGWVLPPEEGNYAYISGTGAYKECVKRWKEFGWEVSREKNPNYKPKKLFSFG